MPPGRAFCGHPVSNVFVPRPPHFDFVLGRSLCFGKVRILDRSLVCGTIVIFGASNFEVSMFSFDISHLFGLLIIEIGKFYQYRYF